MSELENLGGWLAVSPCVYRPNRLIVDEATSDDTSGEVLIEEMYCIFINGYLAIIQTPSAFGTFPRSF